MRDLTPPWVARGHEEFLMGSQPLPCPGSGEVPPCPPPPGPAEAFVHLPRFKVCLRPVLSPLLAIGPPGSLPPHCRLPEPLDLPCVPHPLHGAAPPHARSRSCPPAPVPFRTTFCGASPLLTPECLSLSASPTVSPTGRGAPSGQGPFPGGLPDVSQEPKTAPGTWEKLYEQSWTGWGGGCPVHVVGHSSQHRLSPCT